MPRQKGGEDGDFLTTLFASGLGAYAAKNASSVGGLGWTLLKYALYFILAGVVLYLLWWAFGRMVPEKFTPLKPTPEGDHTTVTPAGNTLVY